MKYLTTTEAAEIIRELPDTTARRCAQGQIRAVKVGKQWRISEDDLTEFMSPGVRATPRPRRLTARQKRRRPAS